MSFLSFFTRNMFGRSDKRRDAGLITPPEIERFDDITYGAESRMQVLDVYRPRNSGGLFPVIVSVHGGGWVYGDKGIYQYYCMDLARRGFAVVNFSYRLAPEHKHPAQLEDVCLAFSWVLENAEKYGLDKDRLYAVGDSAGAHLLSLYCMLCIDPVFASGFSFIAPEGGLPKAVGLNCGVYNVAGAGGMIESMLKDLLPYKWTEQELRSIDPLCRVSEGFPPAYIMTAVRDFLKDDSVMLKKRLDELGVPNEFRIYDDPKHVLGHVFHLNIKSEYAAECNDEECRFLEAHG